MSIEKSFKILIQVNYLKRKVFNFLKYPKAQVSYSFGIDVPVFKNTSISTTRNKIILINSEFKFDCNLDSFELYSETAGKITLEVNIQQIYNLKFSKIFIIFQYIK